MRPENEWFRPEKLKATYFAVEAILLAFVLVIVGIFAVTGVLFEMPFEVLAVGGALLLATFGFVTWWIPAFYRSAAYRFAADEIEYRRGVFFQQKSTVPYNRITNVNASQGPLQRVLDAGTVSIHTAGYGAQAGAELTIGGVTDYDDIKEQVLAKVRRREPEATEGGDARVAPPRVAEAVAAGDASDVLAELRRIRELLEQGQVG